MKYIISVYDLKDGGEVSHQELRYLEDAIQEYITLVDVFHDLVCEPHGVMLYTDNGNIVYGLNEEVE